LSLHVLLGKIMHAAPAHNGCAAGLVEVNAHLSDTDSGATCVNTPPASLSVLFATNRFRAGLM